MPVNFDILGKIPAQLTEYVTLRKIDQVITAYSEYANILAFPSQHEEQVITLEGLQAVVEVTTWRLRAADLPDGIRPDRADLVISTSDAWQGAYVLDTAEMTQRGAGWMCKASHKLPMVPGPVGG